MTKFYFYKTKGALGVLCFSLILMLTLGLYGRRLDHEGKDLQQRLLYLKGVAVRSQEAKALIKTHEKDFIAFEACGFERSLKSEILERSGSYTIEFGPTSSAREQSNNNSLIFQEVSFSIPCLQDRDVFMLLNQLTNQGPGIFQIHEVTITRVSPLSEEMLEKIAEGKPQALFDGRITATWIHR